MSYAYRSIGLDRYKVKKTDDQGNVEEEYTVDIANLWCDCKGFYFSKKPCKHIKFILSQLSDKGGVIFI
ncbi:MAG: SWIM zinc finger family protein [Nitrosopumilus sp.]